MADSFDDSTPQGTEPNSQGDQPSDEQNGPENDTKAKYALAVQLNCKKIIREIQNKNALATSNWSNALLAAPEAISIMAMCLKTASNRKVSVLKMNNLTVIDDSSNTIVKTFRSKYFHTNLQDCSDIGRFAFLDAQKIMGDISSAANSLIREHGHFETIVQLLHNIEDARYDLRPEIERVRRIAGQCKDNAKTMTKNFQNWQLVVYHMKLAASDLQGDQGNKLKEAGEKTKQMKDKEKSLTKDQETAKENVNLMKRKHELANEQLRKVEGELSRYIEQTFNNGNSLTVEAAERFPRQTATIPDGSRGIFGSVRGFFVGTNSTERAGLQYSQKELDDQTERQRQNFIVEETRRREERRKEMLRSIDEARTEQGAALDGVAVALSNLSKSNCQESEARNNLRTVSDMLAQLGTDEKELENLLTILETSASELTKLKGHVDQLTIFFDNILKEIDSVMEKDGILDNFFDPLERRLNAAMEDQGTTENQGATLGKAAQERLINTAFRLQGCFVAISEVSKAYIDISQNYIRPGINKMELLASVPQAEWEPRRKEFTEWCDKSIQAIHSTAVNATSEAETEMFAKMMQLHNAHQLSIEN